MIQRIYFRSPNIIRIFRCIIPFQIILSIRLSPDCHLYLINRNICFRCIYFCIKSSICIIYISSPQIVFCESIHLKTCFPHKSFLIIYSCYIQMALISPSLHMIINIHCSFVRKSFCSRKIMPLEIILSVCFSPNSHLNSICISYTTCFQVNCRIIFSHFYRKAAFWFIKHHFS